ncbi:MAG TPA: SusC/RagA family TonB-linked outer membrane protein [Puia sp.]|nr:SusC/RagA family TonB-linked outer membrane protein [Puia sp.]
MRRLLLVAVATFMLFVQGMAQTITVTGKVTDEKGASVAGATVTEKGTRNATTTRDDGGFSILVKSKSKLVISYVGYEPFETEAKDNLRAALSPDAKALSDIVVTGVGVATSRKKLPIEVASVSAKDFAKSATTSVQQALDGQIAGARVQQSSGTPGSSYNITLRGINSLDNTNPLIMVDGVEMDNLSNVDPASVDHVEVVKGPAGGMLYGAQGANGVIQVFTKKGSLNSKLNISFSSKVSVDNILKGKHDVLSKLHHYVTDASGNILNGAGKVISRDATGIWTDPAVPDPSVNPNLENNKTFNIPIYDHLKQGFRQALTFTNSVSVSGGTQAADYAFTASQLNQQDVLSNNFRRSNLSINLGIHPVKGFTFRTVTQAVIGYENLLSGGRFNMLNAYPFIDFTWKDSTGHYPFKTSAAAGQFDVLAENQWHERNNKTLEIFQNFNFNYKFPRFVELDIKYGLDYRTVDGTDYYKNQSAVVQAGQFYGPSRTGGLQNTYTRNFNQNGLYSAFFRTDFEKDFHSNLPIKTSTQFAYDYRKFDMRQYFAQGIGLPAYPPVYIGSALTKNNGDTYSSSITFGLLVNQTIDYGNLFGVSVGVRSDYGSAFGAAYAAATFPRGTIYFRPSELIKNVNWLSDWKIRGAYGAAGVQPRPFDRQIVLTSVTLGNGVAIANPTLATNDSLRLLKNYELEIGTDFTLAPLQGDWLHRVAFGGSYWHRKSQDIYQNASVAPSTGYISRLDNLSTIVSHGIDLTLDATVYNSSNITWNLGIRWGYSKNIATKISNGQDIVNAGFAVKQGKEIGLFYGQTPLHSVTQLMPDGKTPYITAANQQYYTVASTGYVVDTRTNMTVLSAKNDLSVMGHAYPDFTSSLINNITLWKKLSISFQFDWIHGNSVYNVTKQWLYKPVGGSGGAGASSSDFDKKVTIAGKTGAFVNYYQSLYNLGLPTSPFTENGSYIRLRDVSVTYDLSRLVAATHAIRSLSVTASGRNLLTWTKYTGLDPENTGAYDVQGNDLSTSRTGAFSGVDYFGTPNLKSYQFTLNVGF